MIECQYVFRDRVTKHLRDNGVEIRRVLAESDTSLVYFLTRDDAERMQRNLFSHQLDLDALISPALDQGENALRFEAVTFKIHESH